MENKVIARPAERQDLMDVFAWRNDALTRSMSFDSDEVSLETHTRWFENALISDTKQVYIGLEGEHKIGVCRFDISRKDEHCEVSINLNPICRGRGLAKVLLNVSMDAFLAIHNLPIFARVKRENTASTRLFESCGYRLHSSDTDQIEYIYSP